MPSPRAAPSTGPSRRDAGSCRQRTGGSALLSALGDPAAWLTAAIFFLANMAYASLPVFLPTILEDMGHTPAVAQALAAPPYLVAFVVVLATARASDAMRARAPLLIAHALASTAGYGVLAFAEALGLEAGSMIRYLAVFPATAGFFGVVVLTVSWSINNGDHGTGEAGGGEEGVGRGVGAEAREQKRRGAWGFALLQAVGQCGPLVGTRLYPDDDAPYFSPGMRACAGAMLGVALLASGLRWYLGLMNRRMDMEDNADGGGDGDEMTARLWQGDGVTRQAEEQGSGDGGVDEAESLVARPRSRRSCEKGRGSDAAAGRFRYML